MYGLDYDEICELGITAHGGLTYSEELTETRRKEFFTEFTSEDIGGWVIGFDTAHAWDNLQNCSMDFVLNETERLKNQIENYKPQEEQPHDN